MDKPQVLKKIDAAWAAFQASYAGLPDSSLTQPGVVEDWSVKDLLAHLTTWEQEALKYLPVVLAGQRPPRYSTQYGGLDAFNALMNTQKRSLDLSEVRQQSEETHRQLLGYLQTVPENQFTHPTPFRHRLRLETYGHYNLHTKMIQAWRERSNF